MTLAENARRSKLPRKAPFPIFYFFSLLFFIFSLSPSPLFFRRLLPYPPSVRKLFICFGVEKSHTPIGSRSDGGSLFRGIKGVGFQFRFDRARANGGAVRTRERGSEARRGRQREQEGVRWLCASVQRGVYEGLQPRSSRKETRSRC